MSLVREKVEDELKSISLSVKGRESRELSKTTKEFSDIVLPDIAKMITVAVSASIATAVKDITNAYSDMLNLTAKSQRQAIINRYESDKLEQYQRRDNLRIFGLDEEEQETEDVLEAKVIELASDMGKDIIIKDEVIELAKLRKMFMPSVDTRGQQQWRVVNGRGTPGLG